MKEKLKVTNDVIFQMIFGKTSNERITKKFLERILGIEIESLSLDTNKRLIGEEIQDKIGRIDVKAKLNDGTKVIIEMQIVNLDCMPERLLYYWAKTYTGDLKKGEDYENLDKTIAILLSVSNLERLENLEEGHTKWKIREEHHKEVVLTDKLEIHIIELGKIKNKEQTKKIDWLNFIKGDEIDMKRDMDKELREAIEELERITADPATRELYEEREKQLRDFVSFANSNMRKGLKEGMEQGMKKGMKRGMKEGMREGMEKGIEKGIEQGTKYKEKELIKSMNLKGIDIDKICEIAELSKEEVEKIIKEG